MRSDSPHFCEYFKHERAAADDPFKLTSLDQFMIETQCPLAYLGFCKKARDSNAKSLEVNGPRQIIASAPLNGLNRRIRRVMTGNEDHIDRRIGSNHTLQQVHLHPIRQVQIKHYISGLSLQKEFEASLGVTCGHYLQPFRRKCL